MKFAVLENSLTSLYNSKQMFTIPLTQRQKEVLDFIKKYIKIHGYSPTLREIAKELGIKTPRGVKIHIKALQKKGYLTFTPYKARSISLLSGEKIPLIGISAAGVPISTEEYEFEGFTIDEKLIGKGKHFIVKVTGESMLMRGIEDGDLVVIKENPESIKPGDVVLVKINGEITLKTLIQKTDTSIILKPENPDYPVIKATNLDQVEILGKAVLALKKL